MKTAPVTMSTRSPAGDAFHAHLDGCCQCREQPFNLCRNGEQLLERVGAEACAQFGPNDNTAMERSDR